MRRGRRLRLAWARPTIALVAALALAGMATRMAAAQPAPSQAEDAGPPSQDGASKPHDGIVATVDGRNIHLDELGDAVQQLPEALRNQPLRTLYPLLLRNAIDRAAILIAAQSANLDADPTVRRHMREAADAVLENEYLRRAVAHKVTEAAIQDRYTSRYASLPGIEERRFRIIMLKTRDQALRLRATLLHGADFATLARQYSTDASSINGGEIGFVMRDQLPPALATPVFDQPIGAISADPIPVGSGWDLVKVEQSRLAPLPPLSAVHDEIRRELEQKAIAGIIADTRDTMTIHEYNLDGTPRVAHGRASRGDSALGVGD